MVDITEIYVHWYAGRSKSELAASLGVDRKTVRKYLAPAEAAGISPGGPPMSEADWTKLIKEWFPGLIDRRLRQVTWPDIDQHRDYIKSLLGTVTVSTIHQRLRDEHKLQVSISSFRRWVHATLPDEVAKSQVTVLRDEIEPGSEAQIDYGFLGQWIDPRTGKRHRAWAFVMVLPRSLKRGTFGGRTRSIRRCGNWPSGWRRWSDRRVPGTFPRRLHHQDPPRRRGTMPASRVRPDTRTLR
ncbi:hypothetical protein ACFC5Z_21625 [Streptomyces sp. NPDC056004]|uniref:hypothetical protein n=1 Tax=Streptomyces sp. NPDC056004 TaxID=3345677 RepID=UPI0035E3AFCA